jgi:hypothetical protein
VVVVVSLHLELESLAEVIAYCPLRRSLQELLEVAIGTRNISNLISHAKILAARCRAKLKLLEAALAHEDTTL